MADHGAIFRHCAALRGEFHSALGLRLPEALLASTEACDRPFGSTARSSTARSVVQPSSEVSPAAGQSEEGFTAASISEVRHRSCCATASPAHDTVVSHTAIL